MNHSTRRKRCKLSNMAMQADKRENAAVIQHG